MSVSLCRFVFSRLNHEALTGRVGGAEPEDGQVSAQVLDLVAEEGGVREGRVGRHPDQIVLKLGRHHLVLLRRAEM